MPRLIQASCRALCAAALISASAGSAFALTGDPLNRNGLTKTFGDEFDTFSWYEADANGLKGGGTWATFLGYNWTPIDSVKNRTQIGNKEEELYVDKGFRGTGDKALGLNPFSVTRGILNITASYKPSMPELSGYRYISGMISSQYTFSQTYGVFEMRAKLPAGRGLWPAFWLLPADKSWPPEIDIMEILGHEPSTLYTTLHSKADGAHTKSDIPAISIPDSSKDFHTYAVDWGPEVTIFYFDNKEVARRPTPKDMNKPFFILANLAVGGSWPGSPTAATPFPATYHIDWIRAWQRSGYGE